MSAFPDNYLLVETKAQFTAMMQSMRDEPLIAFDTETNTLNAYRDGQALIGMSFWLPKLGQGYYLDFRHGFKPNSIDPNKVTDPYSAGWGRTLHRHLSWLFNRDDHVWVGFNTKFDLHVINAEGITVPENIEDVMLAAHLVNENESMNNNGQRKGAYTLKRLYRQYFGATEGEDELFAHLKDMGFAGKEKAKGEMWRLSAKQVARYAIDDTRQTWELREFYLDAIDRWNQSQLYNELNRFHRTALWEAEAAGILLDLEVLADLSANAHIEARKKHKELALVAWRAGWRKKKNLTAYMRRKHGLSGKLLKQFFNPASPAQVKTLLGYHGVTVKNTDKATLSPLADSGIAIARQVLDYRIYAKAKSTYYDNWEALVDGDNILHPNHIGTTITGRVVCSEPNLLQLPRKGTYPVKKPLIAPPGWKIAQIDYATQELRVAASFSKCKPMIKMLEAGEDVHQYTADRINVKALLYGRIAEKLAGPTGAVSEQDWNRAILVSRGRAEKEISELSPDEISKLVNYEIRQYGKTANFALLYGMGYDTAAEKLQVTVKEATLIVEAWHKLYPEFRRHSKKLQKVAQTRRNAPRDVAGPNKYRYFQLEDGRVRHYDIFHRQGLSAPYYAAFNFQVQGTCAIITRRAYQKLFDTYLGSNFFQPITMIYDSLVFYVRDDKLQEVVAVAGKIMSDFPIVPRLETDAEAGQSWYAMEAIT